MPDLAIISTPVTADSRFRQVNAAISLPSNGSDAPPTIPGEHIALSTKRVPTSGKRNAAVSNWTRWKSIGLSLLSLPSGVHAVPQHRKLLQSTDTYYGNIVVQAPINSAFARTLDLLTQSNEGGALVDTLRQKPGLFGNPLTVERGDASSYDAEANVITFRPDQKSISVADQNAPPAGVNSAAIGLIPSLREAADAAKNFVSYAVRAGIPHPEFISLEGIRDVREVNTIVNQINENAGAGEALRGGQTANAGFSAPATSVTDHSLSGFSPNALQIANDAIDYDDSQIQLVQGALNVTKAFFAQAVASHSDLFSPAVITKQAQLAEEGAALTTQYSQNIAQRTITPEIRTAIDAFTKRAETYAKSLEA